MENEIELKKIVAQKALEQIKRLNIDNILTHVLYDENTQIITVDIHYLADYCINDIEKIYYSKEPKI